MSEPYTWIRHSEEYMKEGKPEEGCYSSFLTYYKKKHLDNEAVIMDKHKAEAEDEYHSMYRSILNAEQSRANMKSEITTLTQKINKLSVTKAHLEGLTSCASSIFNTANTGLQSLGITKGLNRSVKHRSSGRSIQNAQQAQDLPGLVQVLSEDYVTPTLQSFGETLADLLSCSKKHRGDPMSLYSALDVTLDIFDKMSYWKNFNRTVLKIVLF